MKTKYYYAKNQTHFVNYLFKKDNSFTRLKNTFNMIDTIIYDSVQFEIIKRFHPNIEKIRYYVANYKTKDMHRKRIDFNDTEQLNKIINFIKN